MIRMRDLTHQQALVLNEAENGKVSDRADAAAWGAQRVHPAPLGALIRRGLLKRAKGWGDCWVISEKGGDLLLLGSVEETAA